MGLDDYSQYFRTLFRESHIANKHKKNVFMLLISKTAFDLSTSGKIPFPSIALGWRQTSKYGYL